MQLNLWPPTPQSSRTHESDTAQFREVDYRWIFQAYSDVSHHNFCDLGCVSASQATGLPLCLRDTSALLGSLFSLLQCSYVYPDTYIEFCLTLKTLGIRRSRRFLAAS